MRQVAVWSRLERGLTLGLKWSDPCREGVGEQLVLLKCGRVGRLEVLKCFAHHELSAFEVMAAESTRDRE